METRALNVSWLLGWTLGVLVWGCVARIGWEIGGRVWAFL